MKVNMFTNKARLPYLQQVFKERLSILKEDSTTGHYQVEFNLESDNDVIEVFYAGINFGLDTMSNAFLKR